MSRSLVVIGAPCSTAAAPPTTMNSTLASPSAASSAARSAALGCRGIADPGESLRHPGGRPESIPRRLLERERDQRTVHVVDGRANLGIKGLDERGQGRRLGRRYAWNQ